jgi:amidophosphoribosyltransferase
MKLIPVHELINKKKLLLIDDSIVRGTQMSETTDFLYRSGAKEVHVRSACPPIMFGCKYLNFSRSTSEMDLIARRVIHELEGDVSHERLLDYTDSSSESYEKMVEGIRKQLNFTSLKFHKIEDLIESIGLPECKLCTYCWKGKDFCRKVN